MKYTVKAYLCTNFVGLMDDLTTDNFYEVQDFVWANCQKGFDCELVDNETGDKCFYSAEAFTDYTDEVDELLQDLHMEQLEQM